MRLPNNSNNKYTRGGGGGSNGRTTGAYDSSSCRPNLVEPFDEDHNYVVGSEFGSNNYYGGGQYINNNSNSNKHNNKNDHYYNGGDGGGEVHHHPDSPSAFSQLTTATRRDDYDDDYDGPIVIRVIAPATLQEGYEFDVLVDDKPYTVRVPEGGVKEGQEFETDYDPNQEYKYHNNNYFNEQQEQQRNNGNGSNGKDGNVSKRNTMEEQLVEEEEGTVETAGKESEERSHSNNKRRSTTQSQIEAEEAKRRRRQQQQQSNQRYSNLSSRSSSLGSDGGVSDYRRSYEGDRKKNNNVNNNTLSSARLYDDVSEYTENENMTYLEQSNTYPAQSLSGDDDDDDDDRGANSSHQKHNGEQIVPFEDGRRRQDQSTAIKSLGGTTRSSGDIWYDDNGTPIGGWRTRLCGCCDVLTQSTFWMGFFCPCIQVAQLVTRLSLTWSGQEGTPEVTSLSYNRLILSLIFTMVTLIVPFVGGVCLFAYYLVVVVYIGSQVRTHMRQKYKIPSTLPTRCGDRIDDFCMMLCCGCCSSIQMARHTHDDKEYPGHGCTTTGLEFDAPEIV